MPYLVGHPTTSGAGTMEHLGNIYKSPHIILAASNASEASKAGADVVCGGFNDAVELQKALNDLPAIGGMIQLTEGTFTLLSTVSRAINNVTIQGVGKATRINLDGVNPIIEAGSQSGWMLKYFDTDAGGVDISSATESLSMYWQDGVYVAEGTQVPTHGVAAAPKDGATTTMDWPHGLAAAPEVVLLQPQEAGSAAVVPQAGIDATNFQIVYTATAADPIAVGAAGLLDGLVYQTETTDANDAGANDVDLLPAVPAVDDQFLIGAANMFGGVRVVIGTQGAGTWTITWEYLQKVTGDWVALANVTDGTTGFTAAVGSHDVTFDIPTDWDKTTEESFEGYFVRARVSAYTAVTTQPLADRIYVLDAFHFMWQAS